MAKFTARDQSIKTEQLPYWLVTVDSLNPEPDEWDGAEYDEHSISIWDDDPLSGHSFELAGNFAYEIDPGSGDVTAFSGSVTGIRWRGYAEGDDEFLNWGWEITSIDLTLSDVITVSGPSLEALLFSGDDDIHGARYDDTLRGLAGADHVAGEGGKDRLEGGDGTDWLSGGVGNDTLLGGLGDDLIDGGAGKDLLSGGAGNDIFRFTLTAVAASTDKIKDFTHGEDLIQLVSSSFAEIGEKLEKAEFYSRAGATAAHDSSDRIVYDSSTGRLYYDRDGKGGAASILIATLANKESLMRADIAVAPVFEDAAGNGLTRTFAGPTTMTEFYFGDGNDTIVFESAYTWSDMAAELDLGSGNDRLETHGGTFHVLGGSGRDTIVGGGVRNKISGGTGNDKLTGGTWDDQVFGDSGNDVLKGRGLLDGGEGNDRLEATIKDPAYSYQALIGGTGDDRYVVTHRHVLIREKAGEGNDTVESTSDFYLPSFVQNLILVGEDALKGSGNDAENTIIGNSGSNVLHGLAGDDTMDGGRGSDTLHGGEGKDFFLFSSLGAETADVLSSFKAVDDTIALDLSVFLGISSTPGKIAANQFVANATGLAQHGSERILYNTTDGTLYWDRDGSGTTYAPELFATIQGARVITATDFVMV